MPSAPFASNHEQLAVWQRAMELLAECYRVALLLPAHERYGLVSQVRRAAVSIPANIAEGCGRTGLRDRLRFFSMARGSICELQTLLAAAEVLDYAEPAQLSRVRELLGHTGRLLSGLRRHFTRQIRYSSN